jgi:hypothetical protein
MPTERLDSGGKRWRGSWPTNWALNVPEPLRHKSPYRDFRKKFNLPGHVGDGTTATAFETIYNKLRALEPARKKEIAELPQKHAMAALKKVTAVHIGQVRFIDGVFRPVFQDGDRQYVIDAMGTPFMACGCRKG